MQQWQVEALQKLSDALSAKTETTIHEFTVELKSEPRITLEFGWYGDLSSAAADYRTFAGYIAAGGAGEEEQQQALQIARDMLKKLAPELPKAIKKLWLLWQKELSPHAKEKNRKDAEAQLRMLSTAVEDDKLRWDTPYTIVEVYDPTTKAYAEARVSNYGEPTIEEFHVWIDDGLRKHEVDPDVVPEKLKEAIIEHVKQKEEASY